MSLHTERECDGCRRRVAVGDAILASWYHLYRSNPWQFADVGDSDAFDFCSLPCLAMWATQNRELGVRVIRQPVGVA